MPTHLCGFFIFLARILRAVFFITTGGIDATNNHK